MESERTTSRVLVHVPNKLSRILVWNVPAFHRLSLRCTVFMTMIPSLFPFAEILVNYGNKG